MILFLKDKYYLWNLNNGRLSMLVSVPGVKLSGVLLLNWEIPS